MRDRRIGLALAVPVLALLLGGAAACGKAKAEDGVATAGNGGTTAPASAAAADDSGQKFAQCMRDNGVDMPDPEPGQPLGLAAGRQSGADREMLMRALDACRSLLPNGGARPTLDPAQLEALRVFAQCMRDNGVDVPDPDPNGGGLFGGGNAGQPRVDRNSPAFQKALEACQDKLPQFLRRTQQ